MNAEIIENKMITAKPNSAVASQPCPSGHITADKRRSYASPKLSSATSFIRKTLGGEFTNLILKQKGNFYHLTLRKKATC